MLESIAIGAGQIAKTLTFRRRLWPIKTLAGMQVTQILDFLLAGQPDLQARFATGYTTSGRPGAGPSGER